MIYVAFCSTPIGNCFAMVTADTKAEAEVRARKFLIGEDIESAVIHKVEEIDMKKEDGIAIFWDNELEKL